MKPSAALRILSIALVLAGCDGEVTSDAGTDAASHDAGSPMDATPMDASDPVDAAQDAGTDAGPVETLTIERWGERLYGEALGMTRIGRELWIGTNAVIDPTLGEGSPVRSALARLDLDTGELRVWEDELPRAMGTSGVMGPTPTAGVVADGERRLVASFAGLLAIEGDAITNHPITIEGTSVGPTHLALDRSGGRARLWASTGLGLVELDPDTFAVRQTITDDTLGGAPLSITVDPATGAVFAAVQPAESPAIAVRVLDGAVTSLVPGEGGVPEGAVGDVVWSATYGGAFIALGSWNPTSGGVILWDGADVRVIADEGALSMAAKGAAGPFGTSTLAYDEGAGVLVVGARIRRRGPIGILDGGGLVWIDVSDPSATNLGIVGMSTSTSDIRGEVVTAAAYDPVDHRTYVALQQPCSEVRIGNMGIHAVYFAHSKPFYELPILSTVRDLERVNGELWVGLRADNTGMACLGLDIQVGFARVGSSRGGLAARLPGWPATQANATEIAFFDDQQRILAGWRWELFIGDTSRGITPSPSSLGASLYVEDVEWEDSNTVWVAGQSTHQNGDPAHLADVGPRGALRIVLNDAGEIESTLHYVRQDRDDGEGIVEGLPSAEVYDILIDASGAVHLVCGTEREGPPNFDRQVREEFVLDGRQRRGGVVRIEDDGSITTLAGPSVVPDGRAAAFAPDGTLYVLDATRGLLRQNGDAFEVVALPEVPPDSIPKALWIGEGTDMVAAYSTGAYVRLGDETRFIDGVGYVWNVEASDGVIYLGTDRGLVRVIPAGVVAPSEPDPAAGEAPPYRIMEPPPDAGTPDAGMDAGVMDAGMCIPNGSPCNSNPTGCCPGLYCASFGFSRTCTPS